MTEDQGRVVADEVQALVAVDVPDPAAFAALHVNGVGGEVDGRPRGATRHYLQSALVQLP